MKKFLFSLALFCFLVSGAKAGVYYWVGGTGNWSQFNTHWATTSGGLVFHVQTPTPLDTVIFDANSFLTAGDTVFVDSTFITCKDMDWTNVTNNPVFKNIGGGSNGNFKVYGSLTLSQNMVWNYGGAVSFVATSGVHTIRSATQVLGVIFNGVGGTWVLQDSLVAGITIQAGTLYTNNQLVRSLSDFNLTPTSPVSLYLGTSTVHCAGDWSWFNAVYTLDADSSTIYVGGHMYAGNGHAYHNVVYFGGTDIEAQNCSFDYVYFPPNTAGRFSGSSFNNNTVDSVLHDGVFFSIGGTGNTFGLVNVTQPMYAVDMAGGNTFGRVTVNGDVGAQGSAFTYLSANGNITFSGANTIDTLYSNNPGKAITLEHGKTQTINNKLIINANGGFPVTLQSDQPGTQATISKATDTVCVNYILMQDINATGGAQFYAGQYSTNISNNSGWNWIDCQQAISNVWPGDANYDLMTDNLDVVYIGIAYNETGLTRPSASNTYIAQPAMDWSKIYTNLVNLKHADSDGNGIVNANDTMAVSLNYGWANTGRMAAPQVQKTSSGTDIYFAPTQTVFAPGTWASIPINLGTSVAPASNVYGLAYTINYDASQIQPGTVSVSYGSSWLVGGGNLVHMEKDFYAQSKIDVGMSRISHSNQSGNGTIAYLNFQVANTAVVGPINLGFSNVTAMSYNQSIITTNTIGNSVTVGVKEIQSVASNVSMYPNPFSNSTNISYSLSQNSGVDVNIYSAAGVKVYGYSIANQNPGNHQVELITTLLPAGVYFCKVKFATGEKVFKLVKAE